VSEIVIKVDLNVDEWRIPEARAYRAAVHVNPEYAADAIRAAFVEAEAEGRDTFGEAMDAEGWEPPDDWMPRCLLSFDPDYLLGFAWIPARRDDPGLEYEAFAESLSYGDLVTAFWKAMTDAAEAEAAAAPLANRAERRKRTPASKTGSRSGSASTRSTSKSSTGSPSASSPPPAKSPTKPETVEADGH
jgi:hypothetical protein